MCRRLVPVEGGTMDGGGTVSICYAAMHFSDEMSFGFCAILSRELMRCNRVCVLCGTSLSKILAVYGNACRKIPRSSSRCPNTPPPPSDMSLKLRKPWQPVAKGSISRWQLDDYLHEFGIGKEEWGEFRRQVQPINLYSLTRWTTRGYG
jgi:hypothetical protein